MLNKKLVHIVTYADCSYLMNVAALIKSIEYYSQERNKYKVFVLHSCDNEQILNRLDKTIKTVENNIDLVVKRIDFDLTQKLKSKKIIYKRCYL